MNEPIFMAGSAVLCPTHNGPHRQGSVIPRHTGKMCECGATMAQLRRAPDRDRFGYYLVEFENRPGETGQKLVVEARENELVLL